MTYKYLTSFTISLSGLGAGVIHVPLEICYEVHGKGDAVGLNMTKVTLTDSAGTRYKAHDWLLEVFALSNDLRAELFDEAKAADEAAKNGHAAAIGSAVRL